jgi:cell division protein FtsN
VQTSALPGKGIWYRVRVGHFSDRLAAGQTAQRLTTQERMSAIVAAEEGK